MEKNHIGEQLFRAINYVLEQNGAMMKGGTIVDATILNAPSSTKNREKSRDPEMHQTKKLNVLFACTNLLMYAEAKQRSVPSIG